MKNMIITRYFINAFEEFNKITWPTKDTAIKLTLIVLVCCLIAIILFGALDLGLQKIFEKLIIN
jgi:preprotein translocase SecE subunit